MCWVHVPQRCAVCGSVLVYVTHVTQRMRNGTLPRSAQSSIACVPGLRQWLAWVFISECL